MMELERGVAELFDRNFARNVKSISIGIIAICTGFVAISVI